MPVLSWRFPLKLNPCNCFVPRQQPPQGLPGGKGGMAGMQGRGGAYPPPPMSRTPPMGWEHRPI
eukprot:1590953-Amphidinium_carterae.2